MLNRSLTIFCFAALLSCNADSNPRSDTLFVITDDQSWLHTSFGCEPGVTTPNFDHIAREGVYVPAPSCTASRSAILAGHDFWRLGSAGVLRGNFEKNMLSYQQILKPNGYHTGYNGKGCAPGIPLDEPPLGQSYNSTRFANPPTMQLSDIGYSADFNEFLNDGDKKDPCQVANLARSPEYSPVLSNSSETLVEALRRSDDPPVRYGYG